MEKPDYSGKRSGTGVMFRVSENIELYGAKLGIESAAFDTAPFLTGKQGTRIILKSDDSLLSKITGDSSGCWLKGIPETGKERFEIGITPVRLTIKELTIDPVKTAIPFSLTNEEKRRGDIEGEIIDDGERSILKVYALSNNGTKTDTLKNISEPGILLHRQKRVLEYNKDFMMGDKLDFQVVTKPEDSGKVFVDKSQISGYRAVLVDTSVTSGGWTGLVYEFLGSQLIRCVGVEGETRRLGMVDAEDGVCEVWCDGIVGIAMETDDKKWLLEKDRKKVEIKLRSKGNVVIYSARNKSKQLFPIPPGLIKFKKDGDAYVIKWQDYEDHFLKNDSIYATVDQGEYGEFEIVAQYKSTNQEHTKEKAIILGVPKIESIEFTSDYEDLSGNNLLRDEYKSFKYIGNPFLEPEWENGNRSNPIAHEINKNVKLNMKINFPVQGEFIVRGECAVSKLTFQKVITVTHSGSENVCLSSTELTPNYPCIANEQITWNVFLNTKDNYEVRLSEILTNHEIIVTYGNPIQLSKADRENYITIKRLREVMRYQSAYNGNVSDFNDPKVTVVELTKYIEDRLIRVFNNSMFRINKENSIWALLEYIDNRTGIGGQCGHAGMLAEAMGLLIGLNDIEYNHIYPSIDKPVNLFYGEMTEEDVKRMIVTDAIQPGDEVFSINGHCCFVADRVEKVFLTFFYSFLTVPMGQWGQGCIYYNGLMLPMFLSKTIRVEAADKYKAALDIMHIMQQKNSVTTYPKLQYYWKILKYKGKLETDPRRPMQSVDLPER